MQEFTTEQSLVLIHHLAEYFLDWDVDFIDGHFFCWCVDDEKGPWFCCGPDGLPSVFHRPFLRSFAPLDAERDLQWASLGLLIDRLDGKGIGGKDTQGWNWNLDSKMQRRGQHSYAFEALDSHSHVEVTGDDLAWVLAQGCLQLRGIDPQALLRDPLAHWPDESHGIPLHQVNSWDWVMMLECSSGTVYPARPISGISLSPVYAPQVHIVAAQGSRGNLFEMRGRAADGRHFYALALRGDSEWNKGIGFQVVDSQPFALGCEAVRHGQERLKASQLWQEPNRWIASP